MMGYPDDFILPTSITKAMKQLGNSVCVDVVEHVARAVVGYLERNPIHQERNIEDEMQTLNKGEWSELYSSATNFIYEVSGFSGSVDEVNVIDTKSKIKDRMKRLIAGGAQFSFVRLEQPTHEANLRKVDSKMPEILSDLLLRYYQGQGSVLLDLEPDDQKRCRLKDYLKAVMLGMFPAKPWDGNHTSNGTVLCDQEGQLSILHVLKDDVLKDYLLHNTRLDTPSSSRHRFGSVYKEQGRLLMKLNLQVRLRA